MGEMRRENEECFEQRKCKADDCGLADGTEEATHPAWKKNDRHKGSDAREHTEDDGDEYVLGPANGSFDLGHAFDFTRMHALADHDRIVDEDSEHDDERDHS